MDQDQIIRLWLVLALVSLALLVLGALSNKVTVYRDHKDLASSLVFILSPIVGGIIIAFIGGNEVHFWEFATTNVIGITILSVIGLTVLVSGVQTFRFSIQDNGLMLGVFIGTSKLIIAIIIAISSISLLRYLFKKSRRLGHIGIFFILAGVLGWFVNTLVNGERTGVINEAP
mgnify:CR=1 FL=1